jgi:hypothetical protein
LLTFDAEHPPTQGDRLDAWANQGSVQIICVTAFGDPVDLGVGEARDFSERLNRAIADADWRTACDTPPDPLIVRTLFGPCASTAQSGLS